MAERGRRFRSVRVRVTAVAAVAVAVVLGVASVLLVQRQDADLTDQLDESLQVEADRISDQAEQGALPEIDDDDRLVVVLDAVGDVVAWSGVEDADEASALVRAAGDSNEVEYDDEPYRIVVERYDANADDDGVVYVAGSTDDVDESVAELRNTLAATVPAVVVLLIVVVWIVVGRTLRPVDEIRARVAAIGMAELDRRVPVPDTGDEIARLAETMNDMLARLQHAVVRQQRFVADASHELRTPLTRMRTELEVDERTPDKADAAATRRSQLDEIAGLQRLIEDLLALARSDAGAIESRREPVDLDDIVLEEARAAAGAGPSFDVGDVSGAQVKGDPEALRRVVRNLFDNARQHAAAGVTVGLAEHDATAMLTVDDDGPGVPSERRGDIFDRFARLDESRTGGAHAGLGLAIVADIVTRHGGTVTVGDAPSGGARFVVTLPIG
jgi:signal transduction histidine kinase